MSDAKLTYQDLLQIVELVKASSHFRKFHLKVGDVELDLERNPAAAPAAVAAPAPAERATAPAGAAPPAAVEQPQRGAPLGYPESAVVITSPMVGTFYRAPEPGARPFVDVGQPVESAATVCIIEVMKLMNSIPAGARGMVTHILVDDGEPVEFGQPLMVIEPR